MTDRSGCWVNVSSSLAVWARHCCKYTATEERIVAMRRSMLQGHDNSSAALAGRCLRALPSPGTRSADAECRCSQLQDNRRPGRGAAKGPAAGAGGRRDGFFESLQKKPQAGDWNLLPVSGAPQTLIARRGPDTVAVMCGLKRGSKSMAWARWHDFATA